MKKFYVLTLVLVCIMVAAVAFAGISTTKHNLVSTSSPLYTADSAATLCGFCHIPHGGNTGVANAPLWGRQIRNTTTSAYTVYGAGGKTLGGTTVNQPGTNSLTCLSCHDGSMALGVNFKNGVLTTGYTMVENGGFVTAANELDVAGYTGAYNPQIAGASHNDLTNDHPVGVLYDSSKAGLTSMATASSNGFKFYGTGSDTLECASCHDPHTTNASFKRTVTGGGDFCVGCHANK